MKKQVVTTDNAPGALATYSQAVITDTSRLIFCSGQIAIDPATGELVSDNIRKQTEQVMKNLRTVLKAAGSSLESAVKITAYLTNMDDYDVFNEVYARFVGSTPPARAAVEVSHLPKNALVEIDAIAVI